MDVLEKARETIRRHRLVDTGERVLLACSGGADSTCLLHVMMALGPEESWDLAVAHFNHRLRRDADRDERFVRELADSYGLPFYSGSRDVAAYSRERGVNREEAGRELRYSFLEATADRIGAARIATAHTMDDQAETFLMRLLRGSGRSGLTGIPVQRGGRIVRPLIQVTRADVEAYLEAGAWPFRSDPSNRDRRYLRNRVRLELLPFLRERFDPGIIPRLGRLADILQAEEAWLESEVDAAAPETIRADGDTLRLDMEALSPLPPAIQRRLVRRFLTRLRGDLRGISFEDIETILGLAEGKDFTLEKGLALRRERGRVGVRPDPVPRLGYRYSWDAAEPLVISELGLTLSAELLPLPSGLGSLRADDGREARLDAEKLRLPLTVRSRLDGDRYRPLGAPGRAKLKEIFRARGLAPGERDRRPVFVSGEDIVWVLGLPVSEDFKVSDVTSRALLVRVE